jgi:hypothetical protein
MRQAVGADKFPDTLEVQLEHGAPRSRGKR